VLLVRVFGVHCDRTLAQHADVRGKLLAARLRIAGIFGCEPLRDGAADAEPDEKVGDLS
jgi:hypothetical protein